jgi:xanthine/uracil/vitamin C permease (AzgA family)
MNSELLSASAGILLSLAFSYLPGLAPWFGQLEPTVKRLVMAGALLIVAVATFGLSCAGVVDAASCTQAGGWSILSALVAALVANQATYLISPKPAE